MIETLRRIKKRIKESAGPFTARGKLLDYEEVHAAQLGATDGLLHRTADVSRWEDAEAEPHYYRTWYVLANRPKWIIGAGLLGGGTLLSANLIEQGIVLEAVMHYCL